MKFCSFYSRKVEAFHNELDRYQSDMKVTASFDDESPVLASQEPPVTLEEGYGQLSELDLGASAFAGAAAHDMGSPSRRGRPGRDRPAAQRSAEAGGSSPRRRASQVMRGKVIISSSQKRALHTLYPQRAGGPGRKRQGGEGRREGGRVGGRAGERREGREGGKGREGREEGRAGSEGRAGREE